MTGQPSSPAARKSLGLWMSTALVIGNMIGSGFFLLPASLADYGGISIIAILAFLYSLWTLYGAGAEVVMWGTLLLFAGMPVYVWMKRQKAVPAE